MKTFSTMMIMVAILVISSCKNATEKKPEVAAAPVVDTMPKTPPPPPAFEPFKIMSVTHTVKNFDAWVKSYDASDSLRVAAGLSPFAIARDMTTPNKIYVFNKVSDLQKAKDFGTSKALKAAMQKAGVTGMPTVGFSNVVRFEESPAEYKDRIRVGHKVKDFDAWLKAYDAEGKATRAANGLIDRAISRDISDSSMVYVAFAVSDMAKAKARIADPALKKLMTDAGVISAPVFSYYTVVK